MTRFAVRLPQHQARLVALAISYHLSRPGSETDPETLADYRHGLMELRPELDSQLEGDPALVELSPLQTTLLATALSSVASELKMYSVFDTMAGQSRRPRSTAPGFDERLRTLFPEVAGDPAYASQLAEDIIMLRRALPLGRAQEAIKEEREAATARRARKRWWQVWRR
ncbi:MAG: hypothetical protein E6J43_06555 [Chloroflexi bacterium]|nr:MAG: hypothetical protein E6J43_06555 [Chloroflexota bacterium]